MKMRLIPWLAAGLLAGVATSAVAVAENPAPPPVDKGNQKKKGKEQQGDKPAPAAPAGGVAKDGGGPGAGAPPTQPAGGRQPPPPAPLEEDAAPEPAQDKPPGDVERLKNQSTVLTAALNDQKDAIDRLYGDAADKLAVALEPGRKSVDILATLTAMRDEVVSDLAEPVLKEVDKLLVDDAGRTNSGLRLLELQGKRIERQNRLLSITKQVDALLPNQEGFDLVDSLLESRCRVAICFTRKIGDRSVKHWLGIEPLVELPIGKSFGIGNGSLAAYENNHDIRIDLAAGLRVWFLRDALSVSLYLSKPLTGSPVRIAGSSFSYPAGAVRRPYPGFAIGILFDSLWVAFDRDELRNGDSADPSSRDPAFPPNALVSSTWTVTLAIQPLTAFRTAIGRKTEKK